ncbi:hypothetical protein MIND_00448600 [Mycena indigotica]|uniref:Uncharacterized protein n=1 Tax=Mycena indigotica TaxID=2126181 RepID=A0A8H6W9F9_9AGAR|nr:uncharacterized protein MIND_00448600 [Mycena indigotica]KAF7306573.1 hypothetical protein MIND_00448600 [Mycena indigotica]
MHVLRRLRSLVFTTRQSHDVDRQLMNHSNTLASPRPATEILPSVFRELPCDILRLVLEASAWNSIYFDRQHVVNLLVLSKEINTWIGWIAYHTIVLNPAKVDKFVSFAQSRDPEFFKPRVKVLALTGSKLSATKEMEAVIRDRLQGLHTFHYSCILSPFIYMGPSLRLSWMPNLQFLSLPWRLLAAQDAGDIEQLAQGRITHVHLHFEATDLGRDLDGKLRSTLAKFICVTHLALDRYTDDLLQWLHTDDMRHVEIIVVFVTTVPPPTFPSTFTKLKTRPVNHIYSFGPFFNRTIGHIDFFVDTPS